MKWSRSMTQISNLTTFTIRMREKLPAGSASWATSLSLRPFSGSCEPILYNWITSCSGCYQMAQRSLLCSSPHHHRSALVCVYTSRLYQMGNLTSWKQMIKNKFSRVNARWSSREFFSRFNHTEMFAECSAGIGKNTKTMSRMISWHCWP